jgi:hypothetical protein
MAAWLFLFLLIDVIEAPSVIPTDRGSVVVSDKRGNVRWRADWTMDPDEEKNLVRFTEKGRGRVSPFLEEVEWFLKAEWSAQDVFRPLDFEKTITTVSGNHLATEVKRFDPEKDVVQFDRRASQGDSESRSLAVPPDTLAVEGIAGILRFLPFAQDMSTPVHLLSNEPRLYRVTFENRGKERVRTPAGEFECYKVELLPHLGILDVFRFFYPRRTFGSRSKLRISGCGMRGLKTGRERLKSSWNSIEVRSD